MGVQLRRVLGTVAFVDALVEAKLLKCSRHVSSDAFSLHFFLFQVVLFFRVSKLTRGQASFQRQGTTEARTRAAFSEA